MSGRDRNRDFVEESEFPVDIGGRYEDLLEDAPEEYDEAYVQLRVAIEAVDLVANAMVIHSRNGVELIDGIDDPEEYANTLSQALECAERIMKRVGENPELKEDLSALDPHLLVEARGTIVYCAKHLGVNVSLPYPEEGG